MYLSGRSAWWAAMAAALASLRMRAAVRRAAAREVHACERQHIGRP